MSGGVHSFAGSPPGPVRTCVGCRGRAAQTDLLRVVAVSGAGVPDPGRRLPGRGAYLHPDLQCLERAERRRSLARALRAPGPLDLAAVRVELEQGTNPGQPSGAGHDPRISGGSGVIRG